MKHRHSFLAVLFTLMMLLFVFFLTWYLPSMAQRQFQAEDLRLSLETSRGRERKQQHEYDETMEALPEVQAKLDEILPQAEEAAGLVSELKAERKELRSELKALQEASGEGGQAGE